MGAITIRSPRSGDGEDLAQVWLDAATYYADLNPELFQVPKSEGLAQWCEEWALRPQSQDSLLLLAEEEGHVVGFVSARLLQRIDDTDRQFVRDVGLLRLSIDALVVQQASWRQGIGTQLMSRAEEWGRSRGAVIAVLDTYVDSPVSVPFYEKTLGYQSRSLQFRKSLPD